VRLAPVIKTGWLALLLSFCACIDAPGCLTGKAATAATQNVPPHRLETIAAAVAAVVIAANGMAMGLNFNHGVKPRARPTHAPPSFYLFPPSESTR